MSNTEPEFAPGDRVCWRYNAAREDNLIEGEVLLVLPPFADPIEHASQAADMLGGAPVFKFDGGSLRRRWSYLVVVYPERKTQAPRLYWPALAKLRRTQ
jgi:hypothetical protein